jgi:hypothetical protein
MKTRGYDDPRDYYELHGDSFYDISHDEEYYTLPTTIEGEDFIEIMPPDELGLKYSSGPCSYLIGGSEGIATAIFRVYANVRNRERALEQMTEFMESVKANHEDEGLEFDYLLIIGVDFKKAHKVPFYHSGNAMFPRDARDLEERAQQSLIGDLPIDTVQECEPTPELSCPAFNESAATLCPTSAAQTQPQEDILWVYASRQEDASPDSSKDESSHEWGLSPPSDCPSNAIIGGSCPVVEIAQGVMFYKSIKHVSFGGITFGSFVEEEEKTSPNNVQPPSGLTSVLGKENPRVTPAGARSTISNPGWYGEDAGVIVSPNSISSNPAGLPITRELYELPPTKRSPQWVADYYRSLKSAKVYIWGLRNPREACNLRHPGWSKRHRYDAVYVK